MVSHSETALVRTKQILGKWCVLKTEQGQIRLPEGAVKALVAMKTPEMMDFYGETRSLSETCAALRKELSDYKKALNEEKQKLRKIRRAISSLPEPEHLYNSIVARRHEFHECTKRFLHLSKRIRNIHTSTADWKGRFHELEPLEITCDRIRLEFLFVRCQIHTLTSIPPLLIARDLEAEREEESEAEQEQPRDFPEADNQEQEDGQRPPRRRNPALATRQSEIEQELHRMQKAELNFRRNIQVLMERPTCPPRRFGRGEILSAENDSCVVFFV
ncbi:hypothetical protein V3C99_017683, partial [Haemonchus contortus]